MTLIGSKLITLGHKLNAIHKTWRMLLSPTYWRLRRMGGAIDGELDQRNAEYPYTKIMGEDGGAALRVILPSDRIDAAYSQSGNMCGGCMGAAQLYALTKPRKPTWLDRHSPMFVWWFARVYRGVTGQNHGVSMNNVMKAIVDNGACDNALMPNYSAFSTPPSAAAVSQGLLNQATNYYWLYQSQTTFLDQVADALTKGLPVGVLMRLTWEWSSPVKVADGAEVKSKTATSTALFSHFMVVVGIDRLRKNLDGTTGSLLIKNSWGEGWGSNGTAWCSIASWRPTISSATVVTALVTPKTEIPVIKPNNEFDYRNVILEEQGFGGLPVAYWPLQEVNGTSISDLMTAARGTGYTGTLAAGTLGADAGTLGRAVSFNGTFGQRATVPHNAALNLTTCTIEAWVNLASVASFQRIVSKWASVGGYPWELRFATSTRNAFRMIAFNGTTVFQVIGNTSPAANTWYHVVGTRSPAGIALFVNGASDGTPVSNATGTTTNTADVGIGDWSSGSSGSSTTNGRVCHVAIYNYVLSAERIRHHYLAGINGSFGG